VQSSRRLETEAQRNLELIWLTGRLAPDFKTIADFRRDNGDTAGCLLNVLTGLIRGFDAERRRRRVGRDDDAIWRRARLAFTFDIYRRQGLGRGLREGLGRRRYGSE